MELALTVDFCVKNFVAVGFVFKPCASVGDDLGIEKPSADFVNGFGIICAGRANELADNDAFRSVDDERALFRHEREIAHENFLLLHGTGFGIDKPRDNIQRRAIVNIAFLAFRNAALGF